MQLSFIAKLISLGRPGGDFAYQFNVFQRLFRRGGTPEPSGGNFGNPYSRKVTCILGALGRHFE
jgi:hypothetical protein